MSILSDMIIAHRRAMEEDLDEKMQLLAWQTSYLMTATGNYKKAIKPTDLYKSLEDRKAELESLLKEPEDIEVLRNDLLKTFQDTL